MLIKYVIISTIIWKNIEVLNTMVTERLISFVFAFMAVIIVSLYTKSKK